MPVNKNALIRYRAIDRCLGNPSRRFSAVDLLRHLQLVLEAEGFERGIVKSQLHADLQHMKDIYNAPIVAERDPLDKRNIFYRYASPDFSIDKQPISESESGIIKEALSVLSRFKGMPQFEWVYEIIPAIQGKLGLIEHSQEIISFESNLDYGGLQFITPIFNAIQHKRVLRIAYQDFKVNSAYDIEFHPYYLKQYNSRWFAFGLNDSNENPYWNLALDRMQAILEMQKEYRHTAIDWEDYFYDIIGVTKNTDTDPVKVRLKFSASQAPYVKTKPLHPSQRFIAEDDSGLEISIVVIPNFELEKLILSFGEKVTVLEPIDLQQTMKERIEAMAQNYRLAGE